MRPILHPRLVNGRFGDPTLYVEMLHRREALLFDMGDLAALSARDLLRVDHVFVSHAHIDHFIGFDALLRVCIGRDKRIGMVGPRGFIDRVAHKLQGYEWDLVERYQTDLIFDVAELSQGRLQRACFRFKRAFRGEEGEAETIEDGVIARVAGLEVRAAELDHHGPCLGFALQEPSHANVWKSRLDERGLETGPWLQALKAAVLAGAPGSTPVSLPGGGSAPLDALSDLVTVGPGQKVAYVSDVADTPGNRSGIARLAGGADLLFLEARFAAEDVEQARSRAHLTTRACGEIARAADVRRLEPFHFSPRYEGEEERMLAQVRTAFGT